METNCQHRSARKTKLIINKITEDEFEVFDEFSCQECGEIIKKQIPKCPVCLSYNRDEYQICDRCSHDLGITGEIRNRPELITAEQINKTRSVVRSSLESDLLREITEKYCSHNIQITN